MCTVVHDVELANASHNRGSGVSDPGVGHDRRRALVALPADEEHDGFDAPRLSQHVDEPGRARRAFEVEPDHGRVGVVEQPRGDLSRRHVDRVAGAQHLGEPEAAGRRRAMTMSPARPPLCETTLTDPASRGACSWNVWRPAGQYTPMQFGPTSARADRARRIEQVTTNAPTRPVPPPRILR